MDEKVEANSLEIERCHKTHGTKKTERRRERLSTKTKR